MASPFAPLAVTLRQLQYLVAIAEAGSFSRAARACGVSQPALSSQVQAAEEALGLTLFERALRPVQPTPAGASLLAQARRVLAGASDLERQARSLRDPLTGPLELGVIPTLAPYLLPAVTAALRAELPSLVPRWREEKTPVIVERLAQGRLDAAIVALEADLGDVEVERLGWDPFLLAMAMDDPAAPPDGPVPLAALDGLRMLLLDDGHCLRDQALIWCAAGGASELELRATSLPTLVQMVASGAGATLVPSLALEVENRAAQVRLWPLGDPAVGRTIGLIWRRNSPLGGAFGRLAEVLRGALA